MPSCRLESHFLNIFNMLTKILFLEWGARNLLRIQTHLWTERKPYISFTLSLESCLGDVALMVKIIGFLLEGRIVAAF